MGSGMMRSHAHTTQDQMCGVWKPRDSRPGDSGAYFGVGYTSLANGRQRGEAHVKRDRSIRRKISELNK